MKIKLIIILAFVSSNAFSQFDLYLIAGLGTGNYFNTNERAPHGAGFVLKPTLAGSIGAELSWQKLKVVQPLIGINYVFTGANHYSKYNYDEIPPIYFRFSYISIPIGLRAPIYKLLGIEATCVNSFPVIKPKVFVQDEPVWDIALQPAIYFQHQRWTGKLSYYYGFKDAVGNGYQYGTDFRFFNRIFLVNIAYKVYSSNRGKLKNC
jgi:hypothetical protein